MTHGIFGFVFYLFFKYLSNLWVRRRERRFLRKALGRSLRHREEDSIATWLQVPTDQLDNVVEELKANPFTPMIDTEERHWNYLESLRPDEPDGSTRTDSVPRGGAGA